MSKAKDKWIAKYGQEAWNQVHQLGLRIEEVGKALEAKRKSLAKVKK